MALRRFASKWLGARKEAAGICQYFKASRRSTGPFWPNSGASGVPFMGPGPRLHLGLGLRSDPMSRACRALPDIAFALPPGGLL